jgi:histidinol-phosphate aminotransferase
MARPASGDGARAVRSVKELVRREVAALDGYVPGEQPSDPRIVKLNTNENPYPPSPHVREAILEACDRLLLYPDPTARLLRERVARLYGVDPDGVIVGNGSDELLSMLMRAVVDLGDAVAYPVPTYSLYDTLVALEGGRSLQLPFGPRFELPGELATAEARMRIVCNPNAPSGTLVSTEELATLAAARPDAVLVIDEAYADFAEHTSASLVARFEHVVVLRTLSKSYSLAGLRVGFALASPALARELLKVKDSYNVGRLAQAGALAALADQSTMRLHVGRVRATRERLSAALESLGFEVPPSQANFVLARRPGESLARLATRLRESGILVRYFESLPDALRISIGTDEQIDRLIEALRAAVAA